ncbi:MAG: PKD domain-containing protein [Thermoplasmata archaeon]|nr:PKD domain-containing protein [Thermoplasmata archaeon]
MPRARRPEVRRWLAVALVTLAVLGAAAPSLGTSGPVRDLPGPPPARTAPPGPESPPATGRTIPVPSGIAVAAPESWWNITSESPSPLPVFWFTEGTWDAADQYLMFYGGDNFTGTNLQATETFSNGSWSLVPSTGTSPGPLDGPSLAYDPSAGEVVMYGGLSSYSPFAYTNLTYTYVGGAWTSHQLDPTPPARLAGSMTYDAGLGGVVLFGGYNNSDPTGGTLLNDLWLDKAGAWSPLSDAGAPPVRTWASLSYDPNLGELVLYGGISPSSTCLGDTWTYNGTWTHVTVPSGGPPALAGTELTYDPELGATVLLGGESCTGTPALNPSAWTFNGTAWNALSAPGAPEGHLYGVAAWDPVEQMLVVAGGQTSGSTTDVLSPPLGAAVASGPAAADVGELVSFHANVTGGVPERSIAWDWGDGTPRSTDASGTHVYAEPGTYSVSLHVTDATNATANASATIVVSSAIRAAIEPSAAATDVGLNVTFSVENAGGTGNVTDAWSFGDGATGSGAEVDHVYTSAGNDSVTVTASDSVGGVASAEVSVEVFPMLTVGLTGPSYADAGVPVAFTAHVVGGDPPFRYAWSTDDGTNGGDPTFSPVFPIAGSQTVHMTVEDAANASAPAQLAVSVAAPLSVAITGPSTVRSGAPGTWSAAVTGGVGPYEITWLGPAGANATGPTANLSLSATGTSVLTVHVADAANGSASAMDVVVVTPASSGSTTFGVSTPDLVVAAVLVVAGVAVASVLVLRRSRSGGGPGGA